MELDHITFYQSYLKNYHQVRAIYLNKLLKSVDEINKEIETIQGRLNLSKNTKFIIQSDLRQNYFHCIETFFEIFLALLPKGDVVPDNTKILKDLVKSNWRKNFKTITHIANGKMKLDFLSDKTINVLGHDVSIGHYIFFMGTFSKTKFSEEYFSSVQSSLEAIKDGILTLAIDFSNRDEYNAYKHGIRIFPAYTSLRAAAVDNLEDFIEFDLSNSMSYQTFDDKKTLTSISTKLFDSKRDFEMTRFCGNMIYNMIYLRSIVFAGEEYRKQNKKAVFVLFNKEALNEFKKHNVDIQNIEFNRQEI